MRPSPRRNPGPVLALAAWALSSCTNERLADEWEVTLQDVGADPLAVVDWFPAPGIAGVPDEIRPYFFFNRPIEPGDSPSLALSAAGIAVDAEPEIDFDAAGVRFTPLVEVPGGAVEMQVSVGSEVDLESEFTTDFGAGLLFNMSVDLECESFGADPAHANLLTSLFEPGVYPLWILQVPGLTHQTPLPARVEMRFGPAYIRESNEKFRIYRDFGFSGRFEDVVIEADGRFRAERPGVFLPLDSPEEVIVLYIDQPVLTGRLHLSGQRATIEDARLEGVFGLRWLRKLADSSSSYRIAVDLARLDVDTNGNGTPDSATFVVTSQPEEIFLSEYDD